MGPPAGRPRVAGLECAFESRLGAIACLDVLVDASCSGEGFRIRFPEDAFCPLIATFCRK